MAILKVTTGSDVVANDGLLSLREAVAQAGSGDTIVFGVAGVVSLSSALKIAGKQITIDGAGFGNQVRGALISGQIVVAKGADVTIERATITTTNFGIDAPENAVIGEDGVSGLSGLNGVTTNQPGTKGGFGTDGEDGTAPHGSASGLSGTIVNRGKLTLHYVEVGGSVDGGDGADGGWGGSAGGGGRGGKGTGRGKGADGGDAGNGGSGTDASDGAGAMSGIWNLGRLVLHDSLIHNNSARGGEGGEGGSGRDGADGGDGGDGGWVIDKGTIIRAQPGNGGDGGNGGNGGAGGNGGSAVAGLLNEGKVIVKGAAIFYGNHAEAGTAGKGGEAGTGGYGGLAGNGDPEGLDGTDGSDGSAGADGVGGTAVENVSDLGSTTGSYGIDAHFHAFGVGQTLIFGQTLLDGTAAFGLTRSFFVSRFGDAFDASSVHVGVRILGGDLNARDFEGNSLPGGRLEFGTGGAIDSNQSFVVTLKDGFKFTQTSTIGITLSNPSAGDLLGSDDTAKLKLFVATNHADVIRGTQGARSMDSLSGYDGNDRLIGRSGDDVLSGGNGKDVLEGGSGGDTLIGGAGSDIQTGGAGADTFQFNSAGDSRGKQRDLITDFSSKQGDQLRLLFDADSATAGFQSFDFIGNAGFSGAAGELRAGYVKAADVTRVSADIDGDGAADFAFDLAGRVHLGADDFGL